MTLTQVSTWFANARRRLKKENKWSPEAGFEDDEDAKGKNNLNIIILNYLSSLILNMLFSISRNVIESRRVRIFVS